MEKVRKIRKYKMLLDSIKYIDVEIYYDINELFNENWAERSIVNRDILTCSTLLW